MQSPPFVLSSDRSGGISPLFVIIARESLYKLKMTKIHRFDPMDFLLLLVFYLNCAKVVLALDDKLGAAGVAAVNIRVNTAEAVVNIVNIAPA